MDFEQATIKRMLEERTTEFDKTVSPLYDLWISKAEISCFGISCFLSAYFERDKLLSFTIRCPGWQESDYIEWLSEFFGKPGIFTSGEYGYREPAFTIKIRKNFLLIAYPQSEYRIDRRRKAC